MENNDQIKLEDLTPKQIEEAMLKKEKDAQTDLLNGHAQLFHMYNPLIQNRIKLMNKKGLMRLLGALLEYPLQDKDAKFQSKPEEDTFKMANQLLASKYTMIVLTTLEEAHKKAEEDEAKRLNGEVLETTSSEVKDETL